MPFAFSQLRPLNTGRVTTIDVPLGDYLSNSFSQGIHDSMFHSIMDMRELDLEREGTILQPEEANKRYGIGSLKFEEPIYESQARILRERKEAEMRRTFYLSSGNPDGLFSKRGVVGLGASMLGSILNPLDLAANFIPVVGSEAAALRSASLGRGVVRQALERGLVSAESLGRLPAPQLVTSLVNSGVGNVVAEVPHLISALESKEDYTVSESLVNVIAGTALGTAIHLGLTQAVRIYERLNPDTKETMLKEAADQFLKGKDTDVTKYVSIDESTLRAKVRFNEEAARVKAIQNLDVASVKKAIYEKYHETPVQAAFRFTDGSIVTGSAHWLIDVEGIPAEKFNGMQEGFVTDKGTFVSREEAADLVGIGPGHEGLVSEQMVSSKVTTSDPEMLAPYDKVIFDNVKEAGATDAEAMAEVHRIQRERAEHAFFSRPDIQEKLSKEKEAAVEKIVADEKAKYDEEGRYKVERDAEIQRQIAEGRILTPEQKEQWNLSKKTVEDATTEVKDQIKELTEELKDELEAVPEAKTKKTEGKKPTDVSRRKFIDVIAKLTGAGVTTPLGVAQTLAKGVMKTGAQEVVKKTLLPNLSIKQLTSLLLEHLNKMDLEERALRKAGKIKEADALLNKLAAQEEDTGYPGALFMSSGWGPENTDLSPILWEMFNKSKAVSERIKDLTDEKLRTSFFFEGNLDELNTEQRLAAKQNVIQSELFMEGEEGDFLRSLGKKLEEAPLSELESSGVITPEAVSQVNKAITSLTAAVPDLLDLMKAASDLAEIEALEKVVKDTAKVEKSALEQAIDCLLKNPKI